MHAAYERMYSAANIRPHRIPPYSVHQPSTSSASASGMSNGMRSTSAIMVMRNRAAPRGSRKMFQTLPSFWPIWKSTISMMLNEPLSTATPRTVMSRGISYAVSWAAERIPPIKVYLLLEAHPAKKTPSGATPKIAIMKRRESSGLAA